MSNVYQCQRCFDSGRRVGKLESDKEQLLTQLIKAQEIMERQETLIQSLKRQLEDAGFAGVEVAADDGNKEGSHQDETCFGSHQAASPNTQKKLARHQSAGLANMLSCSLSNRKVVGHSNRTMEGSTSTVASLIPPQRFPTSPAQPMNYGAVTEAAVEIDKEDVTKPLSLSCSRKPPARTATPHSMVMPKSVLMTRSTDLGPPISEEDEDESDGGQCVSRSLAPVTTSMGRPVRRTITPTPTAMVTSSKKGLSTKPHEMAILEEDEGEEDDRNEEEVAPKNYGVTTSMGRPVRRTNTPTPAALVASSKGEPASKLDRMAILAEDEEEEDDQDEEEVAPDDGIRKEREPRHSMKERSLPVEVRAQGERRKGHVDPDEDVPPLPAPPHLGSAPRRRYGGFRSSTKEDSLPRELSLCQHEEEERLSKSEEGNRQRLRTESPATPSTYSTSSNDSELSLEE